MELFVNSFISFQFFQNFEQSSFHFYPIMAAFGIFSQLSYKWCWNISTVHIFNTLKLKH